VVRAEEHLVCLLVAERLRVGILDELAVLQEPVLFEGFLRKARVVILVLLNYSPPVREFNEARLGRLRLGHGNLFEATGKRLPRDSPAS